MKYVKGGTDYGGLKRDKYYLQYYPDDWGCRRPVRLFQYKGYGDDPYDPNEYIKLYKVAKSPEYPHMNRFHYEEHESPVYGELTKNHLNSFYELDDQEVILMMAGCI